MACDRLKLISNCHTEGVIGSPSEDLISIERVFIQFWDDLCWSEDYAMSKNKNRITSLCSCNC